MRRVRAVRPIMMLNAVLCAAGLLAAVAPQSAAVAAATCRDVYFVAARGSGQPYTGDLSGSPELMTVHQGMVGVLASAGSHPDIEVHQLTYPAPSVELLGSGLDLRNLDQARRRFLRHNLPSYLAQERRGERELLTYLRQILATCAGTGKRPKVVLAGYSQGAMVVHNVLQALDERDATARIDLIAGSVLIADPERMPSSQVLNFGTAPVSGAIGQIEGSYGACPALDLLPENVSCVARGPSQEIPRRFLPSTVSICDAGDVVCDTGSLAVINTVEGYTTAVNTGIFIHTDCHFYCSTSARNAGGYVARKLLALGVGLAPLEVATQTLPTATAGALYTATLNAQGGALPYTWSVTGGSLPPGLALSADGTINGTPTTAGSYVMTVAVTDLVGRTSTAPATITVNPPPSGLTVKNGSGPAGIVSWVSGITCPTPTPGNTMWVITQGAGQEAPDLGGAFPFPVYNGGAFVASSNDAVVGSVTAAITCSENTDASSPAGAVTKRTHTFTQTITGPTRNLVITPANDGLPGARFTIADDGGCGTSPHGIHSVAIQVYDYSGQTSAFIFTGLAANSAGRWGPVTLTFPPGPAVSWAVAVQCNVSANVDKSGYRYPVAEVPVT